MNEAGLRRTAERVIATLARDRESVISVHALSSFLKGAVAELESRGLESSTVEILRTARNDIEFVNAVVIDEGASSLRENDAIAVEETKSEIRRLLFGILSSPEE